ncbi:MAG: phosphopyruvate hydratase [Pirellulales bacterium]|nr:phosphopyruvate hydratase [Pirellulales bacterium]
MTSHLRIRSIRAREVLDSRGRPTVEVELACGDGEPQRAIAPSGASTGAAEACELRDGDPRRYDGLGVQRAVENVQRVLAPALVGFDVCDQAGLDARMIELDATPNKSRLGANAILAVSLACAKAAASVRKRPLFEYLHELFVQQARAAGAANKVLETPHIPLPMTNLISGGLHAGGNLDFQDFLVMPEGAPSYAVGLEWIVRVYRRLGRLLDEAGYEGRLVGDEGGYGPRLSEQRAALEFIVRAIEAAGLQPGSDMTIALDVAATHFYESGAYRLTATRHRQLTADELTSELSVLVDEFPVRSIEDGLSEDDWRGWQGLTERLGDRVWLVGDDLFATQVSRIERGIAEGCANSALIKLNQVGTLTETLAAVLAARRGGYACIVSARSGETEDDFLADLAVATAADSIKIGSIVRSERLAKYNRLLRIAEQLEA